MDQIRRLVAALDRWQRRHRTPGVAYGVVKKFSDDNANLLVVSLAWYGFTAIFPLLLAVVTLLGFVGQKSLGSTVVSTLHKFPVVGDSFNPASGQQLHGSTVGLIIGLVGLIYGAQGVTQTAQQAMATVWDVPQFARTGFLPRLGRSLAGLFTIGGTFLINAPIATYVTRAGESYVIRIPVLVALLLVNSSLYWLSFKILTPRTVAGKALVPGAILGGVVFTALITVGTGLVTHQLKNASNTYGTFGSVIGIVAFLLLLAKLSIYAAELNPVLQRRLYPRALPMGEATEADKRVQSALVHEQRRTEDETIGVGFGPDAPQEAAADALSEDKAAR
ncbi:MAG TPA: YhjD/YihY/BrkB family envelope integrity protein [Frankiaceae bacterium]|jgi:uncharacterized BrkB/YihY/UPF0761 family membrane protein|nr:YhjD/YihY/BrkB family envelope integrity protein [Frankiaceae bacterium]